VVGAIAGRSAAEGSLKISDSSIEAPLASEREKAVVPVEGESLIIDRIDDDGTRAELSRSGDRPHESVTEQIGAKPGSVLLTAERKLGEE